MEQRIKALEVKQDYTDTGINKMQTQLKELNVKLDQLIKMITEESTYRKQAMVKLEDKIRNEYLCKNDFSHYFQDYIQRYEEKKKQNTKTWGYITNTLLSIAWKAAAVIGFGYVSYLNIIGG
jgi:flagellar biosynthesis chaperone FliJ